MTYSKLRPSRLWSAATGNELGSVQQLARPVPAATTAAGASCRSRSCRGPAAATTAGAAGTEPGHEAAGAKVQVPRHFYR